MGAAPTRPSSARPDSSAAPHRSSSAKPIGLLGGSFDPIHLGHLQLARDARDQLGLAEVRLIPAAQPWQKGPITDAAHRAHMVQLAISGEPGLVLDMHEIERGGPSYTIDTLRALRASLGPARPLVLVIGADQMARLDTWHEWSSLIDFAHLAVAHRNAQPPALNPTLHAFVDAHRAEPTALLDRPHGAIVDLAMTPVDAAATEIRALLSTPPSPAREARLRALVPAPVLLYIRQQGLYAPPARLAAREKEKPELMDLQKLQRVVVDALEDVKAQDIKVFNTVGLSDMFDRVILASGTSNRQSRALAWSVVEKVKEAGGQVVSVEGTD
ncbi:MAG: nicotinate-nucleotide adenylyltransferase, partial [Burkholderiaceae bacterium]|nr:nicotinate-nucleotide adenylyltransferase [Burkholderiaceae bacterium]